MKNFYLIIIALLGVIGTALTIVADHKLKTQQPGYQKNWFHHIVLFLRKTSFKVFVIIITAIGITFFTFKRDALVEQEADDKQATKDSLTRLGFQQDRAKSDSTIANILADNYIKLDTANKKLTSLMRDSLKREKIDINQLTKPLIFFDVASDTIGDTYNLTVIATSQGGNVQNVNLVVDIAVDEQYRLNKLYHDDENLNTNSILPLNTTMKSSYGFKTYKNIRNYVILFEGTYKDQSNEKYPVKLIYAYVPSEKRLSPIKPKYFDFIYSFFKSKKTTIVSPKF